MTEEKMTIELARILEDHTCRSENTCDHELLKKALNFMDGWESRQTEIARLRKYLREAMDSCDERKYLFWEKWKKALTGGAE